MSSPPPPSYEDAKQILATCYRSKLIGPYRRFGRSSWRIMLLDNELILDDEQVVRALGTHQTHKEMEVEP